MTMGGGGERLGKGFLAEVETEKKIGIGNEDKDQGGMGRRKLGELEKDEVGVM